MENKYLKRAFKLCGQDKIPLRALITNLNAVSTLHNSLVIDHNLAIDILYNIKKVFHKHNNSNEIKNLEYRADLIESVNDICRIMEKCAFCKDTKCSSCKNNIDKIKIELKQLEAYNET